MKNFIYLFLIIANLSSQALAKESIGPISSINIGLRYSSMLENRGVILYKDLQVDPILGIFLFDDKLEFLGDSLSYRDFIHKDKIRLRTKLQNITDNPLFPENKNIFLSSPMRKDSIEWVNRIEFFLPDYTNYQAELNLGIAKDLIAHHGYYVDLQFKYKLFDLEINRLNAFIEPNLYLNLGYGDAKHNQYFYGNSANTSGLNNYSAGLWFQFPKEADRNFPIILIKRFGVLQNKFKNAEFSKNRNEGWLVSFIASYGILD